MKKGFSKKGLSTIVASLLIILLVFVAVAIVWVVIRNLVSGGTSQLDLTSKCLESEISVTQVVSSGGIYNVTILRNSGEEEIGGVKLIFTNEESESNYVEDVPGDIEALRLSTVPVTVQDVANPNHVDAVVYFLDKSGNQKICQTSSSLDF